MFILWIVLGYFVGTYTTIIFLMKRDSKKLEEIMKDTK